MTQHTQPLLDGDRTDNIAAFTHGPLLAAAKAALDHMCKEGCSGVDELDEAITQAEAAIYPRRDVLDELRELLLEVVGLTGRPDLQLGASGLLAALSQGKQAEGAKPALSTVTALRAVLDASMVAMTDRAYATPESVAQWELASEAVDALRASAPSLPAEPVAQSESSAAEVLIDSYADHESRIEAHVFLPAGTLLYTHEQAQAAPAEARSRNLTRLTKEEIDTVFDAHNEAPTMTYRYLVTEALTHALAEKNELAAPAQAVDGEWRLVPVEPTEEMQVAGRYIDEQNAWERARKTYAAMLSASPAPGAGMTGWQPIDENYFVSRAGLVKDKNGNLLGQWKNDQGYMLVRLSSPRRVERVHRLVAASFVTNPRGLDTVNHIDCDRANNDASNLEWCTQAENLQHASKLGRMQRDYWIGKRSPNAGLTDEQVRSMRSEYEAGGVSLQHIADKFGVSKRCAGRVINREVYSDVQ